MVDPPRAGLARKALQRAAALGAERFVYVSCNPTTLAGNGAERRRALERPAGEPGARRVDHDDRRALGVVVAPGIERRVASPRAQGQAMIRTATAALNAAVAELPVSSQTARVVKDRRMTTGTKMPDTRSANLWTSALPFWASSTCLLYTSDAADE